MTELQIIKAIGFFRVFLHMGLWVAALAAADRILKACRRIRRSLRSRNAI